MTEQPPSVPTVVPFGEQLRIQRERRKWVYSDLAVRAKAHVINGVMSGNVDMWETHRGVPDQKTVDALAFLLIGPDTPGNARLLKDFSDAAKAAREFVGVHLFTHRLISFPELRQRVKDGAEFAYHGQVESFDPNAGRFGDMVRGLRERLNISQQALANQISMVDLRKESLQQIEAGNKQHQLTAIEAHSLIKALDTTHHILSPDQRRTLAVSARDTILAGITDPALLAAKPMPAFPAAALDRPQPPAAAPAFSSASTAVPADEIRPIPPVREPLVVEESAAPLVAAAAAATIVAAASAASNNAATVDAAPVTTITETALSPERPVAQEPAIAATVIASHDEDLPPELRPVIEEPAVAAPAVPQTIPQQLQAYRQRLRALFTDREGKEVPLETIARASTVNLAAVTALMDPASTANPLEGDGLSKANQDKLIWYLRSKLGKPPAEIGEFQRISAGIRVLLDGKRITAADMATLAAEAVALSDAASVATNPTGNTGRHASPALEAALARQGAHAEDHAPLDVDSTSGRDGVVTQHTHTEATLVEKIGAKKAQQLQKHRRELRVLFNGAIGREISLSDMMRPTGLDGSVLTSLFVVDSSLNPADVNGLSLGTQNALDMYLKNSLRKPALIDSFLQILSNMRSLLEPEERAVSKASEGPVVAAAARVADGMDWREQQRQEEIIRAQETFAHKFGDVQKAQQLQAHRLRLEELFDDGKGRENLAIRVAAASGVKIPAARSLIDATNMLNPAEAAGVSDEVQDKLTQYLVTSGKPPAVVTEFGQILDGLRQIVGTGKDAPSSPWRGSRPFTPKTPVDDADVLPQDKAAGWQERVLLSAPQETAGCSAEEGDKAGRAPAGDSSVRGIAPRDPVEHSARVAQKHPQPTAAEIAELARVEEGFRARLRASFTDEQGNPVSTTKISKESGVNVVAVTALLGVRTKSHLKDNGALSSVTEEKLVAYLEHVLEKPASDIGTLKQLFVEARQAIGYTGVGGRRPANPTASRAI